MDINEYTLSLVENYIDATGMGEAKRFSLTPADYLLFRRQAVEEFGTGNAVAPVVPPAAPQTNYTVQEPTQRKPVILKPEKKEEVIPKPKTEAAFSSEFYDEEEEESGLEALLRNVPG